MAAFRVEEDADHDSVRLVVLPSVRAGPALARLVLALAAIGLGVAWFSSALVLWLVVVAASALAFFAPLPWLAIGRTGAVLTLSTRDLAFGAERLRLEDIRGVAEGHGTVRISTGSETFDVGHDWPPEWRRWLVQRTEVAMSQRDRQLRDAEPERPPPAALEALRGREGRD